MLDKTSMFRRQLLKLRALETGITFTSIARELGVSRQFVSQVVTGKRCTPRVRRYLCRKLKLNPRAISWTDIAA